MYVRDAMTRNPVTIYQDHNLEEALDKMERGGFRHLPVLNINDSLIGMLSITDLYRSVRLSGRESLADHRHELKDLWVQDVMFSPPITVFPEQPLREAVKIFVEKRIDSLPVITRDNSLVGILTVHDILTQVYEKDLL